jgi:hypothetical protein
MTEKEMQKCLQEALEQENFNQLNLPFILDREDNDNPPFPFVMSDVEKEPSSSSQEDFLTHKIN